MLYLFEIFVTLLTPLSVCNMEETACLESHFNLKLVLGCTENHPQGHVLKQISMTLSQKHLISGRKCMQQGQSDGYSCLCK